MNRNYYDIKRKFTENLRKMDEIDLWLDDEEICLFLSLLKKNVRGKNHMDFLNPIFLQAKNINKYLQSILFLNSIIFYKFLIFIKAINWNHWTLLHIKGSTEYTYI